LGCLSPTMKNASPQSDINRSLVELYRRLVLTFQHFLHDQKTGCSAGTYLHTRGITLQTQQDFSLGFLPNSPRDFLFRFLRHHQYSEVFISESGLFSQRRTDWCLFTGRIVIPIYNRHGEVISFGSRLIDGDGPKYLNGRETSVFKKSHELYGLSQAKDFIRSTDQVVITEGYFDVIACHQAGVRTAVASLGTAFTERHAETLVKMTKSAIIVFDGDSAGVHAAIEAAQKLYGAGFTRVKMLILSDGHDPASLIQQRGAKALKLALEHSQDAINVITESIIDNTDGNAIGVVEAVCAQLFPVIKTLNPLAQAERLRYLAIRLSVDPALLMQAFTSEMKQ
jgi:DNA primase